MHEIQEYLIFKACYNTAFSIMSYDLKADDIQTKVSISGCFHLHNIYNIKY